jgi:hypothetical protein
MFRVCRKLLILCRDVKKNCNMSYSTGKSKTTEFKLSLKVRHEESWRREAS